MRNVTNIDSARKRWIRVSVSIFDHPVLDGGPFSRRDAWLWLLANAAWHEKAIKHKGKQIVLQPGDVLAGRQFLAKTWGWTEKSVRGFLGQCIRENMLQEGQSKGHYANIYTIVNWEQYQSTQKDGASERASQGPVPPSEGARPSPSSPLIPNNCLASSTTPRASEDDGSLGKKLILKNDEEKKTEWKVNTLRRRAEGLGLPVDDLWAAARSRKPKNPHAYITKLCVEELQRHTPNAPEEVIRAYLVGGNDAAGGHLFALMCGGVQ